MSKKLVGVFAVIWIAGIVMGIGIAVAVDWIREEPASTIYVGRPAPAPGKWWQRIWESPERTVIVTPDREPGVIRVRIEREQS